MKLAFIVAATILFSSVMPAAGPAQNSETEVTSQARVYLDGIKGRDSEMAERAATPLMIAWTKRYLPTVFDYKIVRERSSCTNSVVRFDEVREQVQRYLSAKSELTRNLVESGRPPDTHRLKALLHEMEPARGNISATYPCLARVVSQAGTPGLIPDETLTSYDGAATVSLAELIVDVDKPGRQNPRETERMSLSLAYFKAGSVESGWKAVGFETVSPGEK